MAQNTALRGNQICLMDALSPVEEECDEMLNFIMDQLYQIIYEEDGCQVRNLNSSDWKGLYMHGTTHCGCVDSWMQARDPNPIDIASLCQTEQCALRGILTSGFLKSYTLGGNASS